MQDKKEKHQGLSGIPKFAFNILYLPILLGLNIPLLLMNIIYNKIK